VASVATLFQFAPGKLVEPPLNYTRLTDCTRVTLCPSAGRNNPDCLGVGGYA